jgi:hypothetical protein
VIPVAEILLTAVLASGCTLLGQILVIQETERVAPGVIKFEWKTPWITRKVSRIRQIPPPERTLAATIEEEATARAREGTDRGLPAEPWKDADRDFIKEAMQEAADGWNYVFWATRSLRSLKSSEHYQQSLTRARVAFRQAWQNLSLAKRLKERKEA